MKNIFLLAVFIFGVAFSTFAQTEGIVIEYDVSSVANGVSGENDSFSWKMKLNDFGDESKINQKQKDYNHVFYRYKFEIFAKKNDSSHALLAIKDYGTEKQKIHEDLKDWITFFGSDLKDFNNIKVLAMTFILVPSGKKDLSVKEFLFKSKDK